MKKFLFAAFFAICAICTLNVYADDPTCQVGFWFDIPEETINSTVDGVKFGIPVSSGKGSVEGAELSLLCSATENIEGVQFSLFGLNYAETIKGGQIFTFINYAAKRLQGLQLGFANISEKDGIQLGFINSCNDNALFQLGFININRNGWLPVMIFFNCSNELFD